MVEHLDIGRCLQLGVVDEVGKAVGRGDLNFVFQCLVSVRSGRYRHVRSDRGSICIDLFGQSGTVTLHLSYILFALRFNHSNASSDLLGSLLLLLGFSHLDGDLSVDKGLLSLLRQLDIDDLEEKSTKNHLGIFATQSFLTRTAWEVHYPQFHIILRAWNNVLSELTSKHL